MTQDKTHSDTEVILGKTHFTYPGEDKLIPHSAEAIASDQRHIETMRLTGLEILRRAGLMPDSSQPSDDQHKPTQS